MTLVSTNLYKKIYDDVLNLEAAIKSTTKTLKG